MDFTRRKLSSKSNSTSILAKLKSQARQLAPQRRSTAVLVEPDTSRSPPSAAPAPKRARVGASAPAAVAVDPPALAAAYGRHEVLAVERLLSELQLELRPEGSSSEVVQCRLAGSWLHTRVSAGDLVHVLAERQSAGNEYLVNDRGGLLVVQPDHLVSGTSVVASLFCLRQAVLNERFKGLEGPSKTMFIGTLVHELLQDCLAHDVRTRSQVEERFQVVLARSAIRQTILSLDMSLAQVRQEVEPFLPHIQFFTEKYVLGQAAPPPPPAFHPPQGAPPPPPAVWPGRVEEVCDIEENIWSPRLGMKGKVDLTVRVKLHGRDRLGRSSLIMPLELKTGRPSGSAEHRGQVIMYSMMMAERRPDPESGLLLYLRNSSLQEVKAGIHEMRGLVQLRNELVTHLRPSTPDGSAWPALPEPINLKRACAQCPHLMTCAISQKLESAVPAEPHAMSDLVPKTLAHLDEIDLKFFQDWSRMCALEAQEASRKSKLKDLWCQTPRQREAQKSALAHLKLVAQSDRVTHLHTFGRHSNSTETLMGVFQTGETVVLSSDTELALAQGVIVSLDEGQISTVLDKTLKQDPTTQGDKIYHLDRYEYQGSMASNLVNLAKLMADQPRAQQLRAWLIHRKPVTFAKGLPKDIAAVAKPILRSLNPVQQRAIFKLLMANDFVTLKGMPGTGKTTLIVALVRLMVALGKTILLTSYTHSAVDNILLKLRAHESNFLRLGRLSRIHPDLRVFSAEHQSQEGMASDSLENMKDRFMTCPIVATTCLGLNHPAVQKRNFDYCIVDEASQAQLLSALGTLFHCEKFVLVGDPDQLPPVVQSSRARELGMDASLFSCLEEPSNRVALNIQYRMNATIMACANHLTYVGQLQCGSPEISLKTLTLNDENRHLNVAWLARALSPKLEDSVLFVDTQNIPTEDVSDQSGLTNPKEALLAVTLIRSLGSVHSIGVVAPYRAQVNLLRQKLDPNVDVNTVDQFQGKDKDVILYCTTRTRPPKETGVKGDKCRDILDDARRLNVAITRAKCKFIMMGHGPTLMKYPPIHELLTYLGETGTVTLVPEDL
eukprot:maker-scaffold757_size101632-snap-gene-0.17 protein:Tk09867 transcript:maker-scaffold757_size101632-snap-gene-0.17-mRNA-1 annotation:"dna replication atp-dependent helicase nuclease dna2-like"